MQIKLSTIYASPHMTAQPGSVIDVSEEEGLQLIAGRYGALVETAAIAPAAPAVVAETAAIAAPEKRTNARGSRSRTAAPAAPETPKE